jgi:hypothetical protein
LQNVPSLQPVPFGSFPVQLSLASLHEVLQLASVVFGAGHGFVPLAVHTPPWHESVPLQNVPSLQPVPFGSAPKQLSATSLHDVAQLASVVFSAGHGFVPLAVQTPAWHESVPLQNVPSLQPVPFGSANVQLSVASLHDVAQLASVVLIEHGFEAAKQLPPEQVSAPLQNNPSWQLFVLSFVMTQPVVGFDRSDPGLHTSSVHAFKSLQFVLSGVDEQAPVKAAQASFVQDLLSLQDATLQQNPPTHAPAAPLVSAHCVLEVHACPGAFLYDRSSVGPFPVCVSLE